jgi:hypothetical protein
MVKILLRPVNRNWERLYDKSLRTKKKIYRFFSRKNVTGKKAVLFVIGCQRSGTTLMTKIFERDLRTAVYGEFSKMSALDTRHKIRLNPLPWVKAEFERDKVPLIVLKPLVETQNALKLLEYFEDAKALWMYRDYRDVASSNLAIFGMANGISNLRAIAQNAPQNWRSENVSDDTRNIVLKYFSEEMNPYDAAALFWLARNRLFFELGLDRHPRLTMCKYEDLLAHPERIMRGIYRFTGTDYPSDDILVDVRADSGKGKNIKLSPAVELLCKEMLEKLDTAYEPGSRSRAAASNE